VLSLEEGPTSAEPLLDGDMIRIAAVVGSLVLLGLLRVAYGILRSGRAAQAASLPGAGERRVHPERRAVALDQAARRHAVGGARRHQRDVAERVAHPLVALPAVGGVVTADVDPGRRHLPRDPRDDLLGPPGQDAQASVGALLQLAKAAVQEGQPRSAGRAAEHVVEDEQRQHLVRTGR